MSETLGGYRENLAKELTDVGKSERPKILDEAKEKAGYWQARFLGLKERQGEEKVDGGLGIFLRRKTLYHGSFKPDIDRLDKAENTTVGTGVYFTPEPKDAIGYARRRSGSREGVPTIYEVVVENVKLVDLRDDNNVRAVLRDFKDVLVNKLGEPNLRWNYEEMLRRAVSAIDSNKAGVGNLREVAFSTGDLFSDYLATQGYHGLVTFEGGEGDVGNHETYLIFDPDKVKTSQRHKVV